MFQVLKDRVVTTLGVGPTDLLTSVGIAVGGISKVSFILANTGSSNITNVSVHWLDSNTVTVPPVDWSPPDVGVFLIPPGYLAPGMTIEYTITDITRAKMRLTVTGAAGQTVRLSMSATWD